MIERRITPLLQSRLRDYPAVVIVGPRQCGKTTLARSLGGEYFDLERESDRVRLDIEFDRITESKRLVILDEAQNAPEVFPRLRGAIDRDRSRTGRFLLLGSVSPRLMLNVSESLAGRLAILELTPLLLSELPTAAAHDRHWLCGGFPDGGILAPRRYGAWQRDYLELIVSRDLPEWGLPSTPQQTMRLLRMVAAVHGQTWNASQIGRSLGLDYKTVNRHLDYLVGAFLIRRLQPWSANVGKRLVRSPKIFWRDSGLMHGLEKVADREDLLGRPWVGASWEGYVIEQILGRMSADGVACEPWYFRTSAGEEIDLVLDFGGELWGVEIKLTTSPTRAALEKLRNNSDLIGAARRYIVAPVAESIGSGEEGVLRLEDLLAEVGARGGA